MTITITDFGIEDEDHDLYEVTFFGEPIRTTVTTDPDMVDSWISEIEQIHYRRLKYLTIGLDVEWRPSFQRGVNNPVATIQLCVGHRCLIFQIIHSPSIPQSLVDFLMDEDYTFVGVGIQSDVDKLESDYQLSVRNVADLRECAVREGREDLRYAGIKGFVKEILGREVTNPGRVRLSRWDNWWLSLDQIQYACMDAFVSFEIGKYFRACDYYW